MKKKLSDKPSALLALSICFVFISVVSIFAFRALTTSGATSYVQGEIPLVRSPSKEPLKDSLTQKLSMKITAKTPVVVLTSEAFLLGDSDAFTGELSSIRNKYEIRHVMGQPQIVTLVSTLTQWDKSRGVDSGTSALIFSPTSEIPMPIVIKVMAAIQDLSPYNRIVLAGGVI